MIYYPALDAAIDKLMAAKARLRLVKIESRELQRNLTGKSIENIDDAISLIKEVQSANG